MSNKKRIEKKVTEIKRKNFLTKYKVRVFKKHKLGIVFTGEVHNPHTNIGNENFWSDGNQKGIAIPLKKLEGMLALESTKDGGTRAVFAGSRDYIAKQNRK